MRLICPNCGAQYEVAEDVIPTNGRDVQCSNCGHTWFETPGASELAESDDIVDDVLDAPEEHDPDHVPWDSEDDDDDHGAAAPQPPRNRPALDASVAEILREEAERETAARRAAIPDPMESQDDLGLQDPPALSPQEQRNIEAARRMARITGDEAEKPKTENVAAATAAAAAATRRELLPDIEEINSTLRSSADRGEVVDPTEEDIIETKRRGFRFGFFSVLLIIAILWVVYVFADQISAIVPSLEGTLNSYVETVDNARLWLDLKVQGLMETMEDAPAPEATEDTGSGN